MIVRFSLLALLLCCGCSSLQRGASQRTLAARQMALLGCTALEHGKERQAEELFQNALQNCPEEERAHRNYAELLWRRGDRHLGMQHMQRVAELSPGDVDALVRLGKMHLEQNQLAEALRRADQAVARDAEHAAAWALRGEALLQQGRLDESLDSCHRSLNLQEGNLPVEMRVAAIYRQLGRPRRALSTLDVVAARHPPQQLPLAVLEEQHLALKSLGRMQSAERKLAELTAREPSADRLCRLCELRQQLGHWDRAWEALQGALAIDPANQAAQSLYAALSRGGAVRQATFVR